MPPPTVSGMKTCRAVRFDDLFHDFAAVAGGSDVEEDQLVRSVAVIDVGQLDRISGVAKPDEVDAFDNAPCFDVQAGNDALR